MSIQARIRKVERTAQARKGREKIAVHLEGQDYVTCEGVKVPLAEWKQANPDDVVIHVAYDRTKPITNDLEAAE